MFVQHWKMMALLVGALALTACDDGDSEGSGGGGGDGGSGGMTPDAMVADSGNGGNGGGGNGGGTGTNAILNVATYNAGLATGFVDYAAERVEPLTAALAGVDVDVLCLQEVWSDDHRVQIEQGLMANLPHTYHLPPDAGECTAGCTQPEVDELVECLRPACGEVPPGQLFGCATENCQAQIDQLSTGCTTCIAGELGAPLDDIVAACEPGAESGSCYAYGASFGTDIVSRYPLADTDALVFESHLNRRSVLHATVQGTLLGDVHVFCTHLTSHLSRVNFPGEGTWAEEQAAQITAMRAWIDMKAAGGPVVLMGDFNNGPEIPGRAVPELIENFTALTEGYDTTYTAQADADCTFCNGENALITGGDHENAVLLDHVLLKGFESVATQGERILTGRVTLMVEEMPVESAYSDHYGIRVNIAAE